MKYEYIAFFHSYRRSQVDILHIKSECDILQNPGFEVYHIHSEVYYVAVTWQNRCLMYNMQI